MFLANHPLCLVGMEACGGSHYWAREVEKLGHEVRLMNPKFVKAYVKSNKNDYNDAEAICEAVTRPSMRFVPIKNYEQQDVQLLHRIRSHHVKERTMQAAQIRGLLGEYGVVIPKGIRYIRSRLPAILEDKANQLTEISRELFAELYDKLVKYDIQIKALSERIAVIFKNNEVCQRLEQVPGIGVLTATALFSAIGNGHDFKNARHLSAWLGLVPRQESTGGRDVLLGISKRGNKYLRTLLIHGARTVVYWARKKNDPRSRWINELAKRRGENIAAVAVANKNARIIWAILSRGECFKVAT